MEHSTSATPPTNAHPVHARKDGLEMWTRQDYSIASPATTHEPPITSTPHDRDNLSGSDGTVDPITGDRACASVVHYKGRKYLMTQRFEASEDSISYRAELEGIYNTLKIAERIGESGLEQICDDQEAINKVNQPMVP